MSKKPVKGFKGYRIDSDGHVESRRAFSGLGRGKGSISVQSSEWKPKKAVQRPSGYMEVGLQKNGKSRTCRLDRLVLETFVGPCPPKGGAEHMDGDLTNNRLDNLRWAPRKNHRMKITDEQVFEMRCRAAAGQAFGSLATRFAISRSTVAGILQGRSRRDA